jgi:hypothetical protein
VVPVHWEVRERLDQVLSSSREFNRIFPLRQTIARIAFLLSPGCGIIMGIKAVRAALAIPFFCRGML